jgi:hypothetical protein
MDKTMDDVTLAQGSVIYDVDQQGDVFDSFNPIIITLT